MNGAARRGVRIGNWLEQADARELLWAPCGAGKKAIRDRAVLGLLIRCALRRAELARLQVRNIEQRAGRWVLPDLVGKGGRVRTVPLPDWVKLLLDQWVAGAEIHVGPLFRSINKGGAVSPNGFTENAVWGIVRQYAGDLDLGGSGANSAACQSRQIVSFLLTVNPVTLPAPLAKVPASLPWLRRAFQTCTALS